VVAPDDPHAADATVERLRKEVEAMIEWASGRGKTPPPRIVDQLFKPDASRQVTDIEALVRAHGALSQLVSPARPDTVVRLMAEARSDKTVPRLARFYRWLGPLPIVRQLVLLTLAFLIVFVAFAASPGVRRLTAESTVSTTTSVP
jgi:hypothetical protein